jgi:hypothetical protein
MMGVERVARRRSANATASTTESGVDGRNLILTTAPQGRSEPLGTRQASASWFRRILQARIRYSDMGESGAIENVATSSFRRGLSRREWWRSNKTEGGPRFSVCQRRGVLDNSERMEPNRRGLQPCRQRREVPTMRA